jgi:hypothetical protein
MCNHLGKYLDSEDQSGAGGLSQMNGRSLIGGVMLILSLAATHRVAGQDSSLNATAESRNTEHALKILSGSTQFIEAAPAFSVRGEFCG